MPERERHSHLRDLIQHGRIGPVWCEGTEVLRRIFVTVRDRNWQEVTPTHLDSEANRSHGTVTMWGSHINEQVAFDWKATLSVSDDMRKLQFTVSGQVLRDMEVCRLGLVVLHPIESLVSSRLVASSPKTEYRLTVPDTISPQPIVDGLPLAMGEPFSKLTIQRPDLGALEFEFEGDLFELEDQRNWGDATFKTYCTPLRLGFPRAMRGGTSIQQSIEVRFNPTTLLKAFPASSFSRARTEKTRGSRLHGGGRRMEISERTTPLRGVFPTIGREYTSSVTAVSQKDQPAWHHIYFEVEKHKSIAALRALLESVPLPTIDIGIEAGDERTPPADALAWISTYPGRISYVLLHGSQASLPSTQTVERWRRHIKEFVGHQNVRMLAATRGYFVEFNRGVAFEAPVAGIAFPLTATVHSDDTETITDNVNAIRDMAETARRLTRLSEIVAAPLALYHPSALTPRNFPEHLILPWLAATLIQAAMARVTSVTLGVDVLEGVGTRGYPALAFLSRLIECAGLEVMPLKLTLPPGLHTAAFKSRTWGRARMLAANLNQKSAVIPLAQIGLRATMTTNTITGATSSMNSGEVEVPEFGIIWIELSNFTQ